MKYGIYIIALLTLFVPSTGAALETSPDSGEISREDVRGAAVETSPDSGEIVREDVQVTALGPAPDSGKIVREDVQVMALRPAPDTDEISPEDVRVAAVSLFEERFPGLAGSLQVRVQRVGSKVDGASGVRVRLGRSGSIPKGHTRVELLARDGDGWSEAGWALLYVAHFDSIAIARNNVARNEPVADEDVSFAWMETTTFRGEPLRPAEFRKLSESELFADRPLRSGESVRAGDLRAAYAADTGQSITMTYRKNDLVLTLTCQAREPGHTGEVIRAYSPDTKATYKVELTGPGTAVWTSTL